MIVNDSCESCDIRDSSIPPRNSTNASPSLKSFLSSMMSFSILVNLASSLKKLRSIFLTPSRDDEDEDGDGGGDLFLVLIEDLSLFLLLQRDCEAVDLFLLSYLADSLLLILVLLKLLLL